MKNQQSNENMNKRKWKHYKKKRVKKRVKKQGGGGGGGGVQEIPLHSYIYIYIAMTQWENEYLLFQEIQYTLIEEGKRATDDARENEG